MIRDWESNMFGSNLIPWCLNAINEVSDIQWSITYIFHDIKKLLSDFQEARFTHTCREVNIVADIMANWSVINNASIEVEDLQLLPREAKGACQLGKFGSPGFRKKTL